MRIAVIGLVLAIATDGATAAKEGWSQSTLSKEAIELAKAATKNYHRCLTDELKTLIRTELDSRDASNIALRKCEPALGPIRQAFQAEQVPQVMTDRYLLRKRHQAARQVLRTLMFAQSRRHPAKD